MKPRRRRAGREVEHGRCATCSTGHVVARCATACLGGTTQLCDPGATQAECTTGTCMNDPADLEGAGLPNDPLYGVCK